ncbi:phospholipase [Arenibacter sp. H213]|uniref:Alpha/beta hydrolase n=1 Tax=Arenibacter antarcticus TaxID=2040469 RepID=A0ABW5VFF9_9FLAO|nr:alpha/beta fold hydrolase [Arenibacter sp. H213]MCM4166186.1 phospholipase [Arenibacter sp. H213]
MTTAPLSLEHLIRPSDQTSGKPPVLFMFHGYGSNEEDLFSFAPELPKDLCIISVRAPYPMQPYGNMWYTINFEADQGKWNDEAQAINSRDKIKVFIEEACSAYGLDETNVTLLGFSQGTILSYAVALSYPHIVKNVIALSGYISTNMLLKNYWENDFKNLKIYASHGSVDQVIPVTWAQKVPNTLTELGIDHVYEEFPVGHGVAPQNFHSFNKWLEDKI